MKLGPDMYNLNTFNIPKHEVFNKCVCVCVCVCVCGEGGASKKPPEKCQEIKRILAFTSSKTNSDNAKEKEIFYSHP